MYDIKIDAAVDNNAFISVGYVTIRYGLSFKNMMLQMEGLRSPQMLH
jgi:hypothetical protein